MASYKLKCQQSQRGLGSPGGPYHSGKAIREVGVTKVISISSKRKKQQSRQALFARRRKAAAVRKIMQCSRCALRCEKCGAHMEPRRRQAADPSEARLPYRFCSSCEEEYRDFIERLKGRGDPDCYWRNELWLDIWKKWIDYQGAVDSYLKSKEFIQLLQELEKLEEDE
jgi:hypothetical protein